MKTAIEEGELIDPGMLSMRPNLVTVLQKSFYRKSRIGLDTIVAVSDVIAADAKFNLWVSGVAKRHATEDQFMRLLLEYDSLTKICITAVNDFLQNGDGDRFQSVLGDIAARSAEITRTALLNSN